MESIEAKSEPISRRTFGHLAMTAAAGLAAAKGAALTVDRRTNVGFDLGFDVTRLERPRVLESAKQYLGEKPITITDSSSPRSAGGKHDYFSEADYWWPDPKDPNGPYTQRDGMSNPENFVGHRHALIRLGVQVPALTAAWILTKDRKYSKRAAQHLRVWFLEPATLMNPNLQFAQAIHGRTPGRGTGIIDTIHLVEVARSIPLLADSQALTASEVDGLKTWFAEYLEWMTASKNGTDERDAKNNHGTWWVTQVAEFARFTGNEKFRSYSRDRFKTVLVPNQIAADGSLPDELRRTKPYHYCLFDITGLAAICQSLTDDRDNLFAFSLPDGRSFGKTVNWMLPYIENKSLWPNRPDVEYFQYWPIRQASLLFAGIGLAKPECIKAWQRLPSEPKVEEIVRNNPIGQPLLWLNRAARS